MKKSAITLVVIGLAFLIPNVKTASAQTGSNPTTYLSATGTNSGTCATSPCRTLTYALTQTSPGGRIAVDSLSGAWESTNENVTITGSVSIHGSTYPSSFGAATGTALTINAGINDTITITDMHIDNYGTATNGIVFNSGAALVLDGVRVNNFSNVGVTFSPNTSGGNSKLFMLDARVTSNANGNILIKPVGTTNVLAQIKDSLITTSQNLYGLRVDTSAGAAQVQAEVIDTSFISLGTNGIVVSAPTYVGKVFANGIHVSDATVYGVAASGANATILLNNSSIVRSGNSAVYGVSGGTVASSGNNAIYFNTNDNTAILSPQPLH